MVQLEIDPGWWSLMKNPFSPTNVLSASVTIPGDILEVYWRCLGFRSGPHLHRAHRIPVVFVDARGLTLVDMQHDTNDLSIWVQEEAGGET